MKTSWFSRAAAAGALVAAAGLLAACGSGSTVQQLTPTRFMAVGDGMIDLGHDGKRYTINDGSMLWTQQLASHFGLTLADSSTGGLSYARGNARITAADPTGGGAPSLSAQVDALLARLNNKFADSDVIILSGGHTDIVTAVNETGISATTTATVKAAGAALGDLAKRLSQAGAKHVVVSGVYNLGLSPWARAQGEAKANAIRDLSVAFNDAMLLSLADTKWGRTVLAINPGLFYNLIANETKDPLFANAKDPVCTTPDATTCTNNTLVSGAKVEQYLFADKLYFTPLANRLYGSSSYGNNAYSSLRDHW